MLRTIRVLGMVLAHAEHDRRNVRCNEEDARNVPFKRLNRVGDLIVRATGGWPVRDVE
jgi:hypothetical protein